MYVSWKYIIIQQANNSQKNIFIYLKYKHSMDLGWELKTETGAEKLDSVLIYVRFRAHCVSQYPLSIFLRV